MKRTALLFALTLGTVSLASASPNTSELTPENPLETPWTKGQLKRGYIPVSPDVVGVDDNGIALASSNTIYLNNCKPNGCQVSPGNESAATNRSSIVDRAGTVAAYSGSDAQWQQVVSCVKDTYKLFNVNIVTERPTSGTYHMAIVAGRPTDVGFGNGILGVSPFSCGYIPGGISYSFANVIPSDIDEICWTVSQETAHSWGLDHKYDNKDPMTYLQSGPSRKTFQNTDGPCGTYSQEECMCNGYNGHGNTMNSVKEIMATFGPVGPPTPPSLTITAPRNNDQVDAQFPIRADISDDIGVSRAELYIDGQRVGAVVTTAPFVWNAPASLQEGTHQIKVVAYDIADSKTEKTINVTYGTPCNGSNPCEESGDVCVDGRCVAGQGVDGGLGTSCGANDDCVSNSCINGEDGRFCVESCIPGNGGCPSGFGCAPAGDDTGVCWAGYDDGGGGCSTSHPREGLMLLGLGLGALLITRRRRR